MSRLQATMQRLRQEQRKALSLFLTAGFPSPGLTVPLVAAIERGGADMVELGIPFSDPIADGPAIQASSEAALRQGVTLRSSLDMARAIRSNSQIPLVMMGYL